MDVEPQLTELSADDSIELELFDDYGGYSADIRTPLREMRAELFAGLRELDPDGFRYRRELGVDHPVIEAECGTVVCASLHYFAPRTFDFGASDNARGIKSAVVEVFDTDRETVIDLCAWPLDRPDKFATAIRRADGLGVWRVTNPATYHVGQALRVHRTPDAWLRAGCDGVVILNPLSAPRWLAESPGQLIAEDIEHGREIGRMLHPFFPAHRILAPLKSCEAA